jgi:hypothetical protein
MLIGEHEATPLLMRLSCITKGCLMLIFDPKSGQSVQVDLTAGHRPFHTALGSSSPRKVPAENKVILAPPVRFDLGVRYKTARHSRVLSNDEYNKNKPAVCVHNDCLHHAWARTRNDSA